MARRGRPPERGGGTHAWTFDHCRDAKPRSGYLAGPLHWLLCHDSKPTKPCYVPLYGTNANCPYCRAKHDLYEFGYQPVRDLHGRPWVVGIRDTHERVVSRIGAGQGVRWGRAEGVGQGCYVEPWPHPHEWRYWYPDLEPDADLTHWLCRLWELPTLAPALAAYWADCDRVLSPTPAPADPVDVPEVACDPAARKRWEKAAAESRAARAREVPGVGDIGAMPPGRNGRHPQ